MTKSWMVKWGSVYWTPGFFTLDKTEATRFMVRAEARAIKRRWEGAKLIRTTKKHTGAGM